jgi:large subunit ribosomal protein L30
MRQNWKDDYKSDFSKYIEVEQIHSSIGTNPKIRATLRSLGLGKIGKKRKHKATPQVVGMINKVKFLVKLKEI